MIFSLKQNKKNKMEINKESLFKLFSLKRKKFKMKVKKKKKIKIKRRTITRF